MVNYMGIYVRKKQKYERTIRTGHTELLGQPFE